MHGLISASLPRVQTRQRKQDALIEGHALLERESELYAEIGGAFAQHGGGGAQQYNPILHRQARRLSSLVLEEKLSVVTGITLVARHVDRGPHQSYRIRVDLKRAAPASTVTMPRSRDAVRPFNIDLLRSRQLPMGACPSATLPQRALKHHAAPVHRHDEVMVEPGHPLRERPRAGDGSLQSSDDPMGCASLEAGDRPGVQALRLVFE